MALFAKGSFQSLLLNWNSNGIHRRKIIQYSPVGLAWHFRAFSAGTEKIDWNHRFRKYWLIFDVRHANVKPPETWRIRFQHCKGQNYHFPKPWFRWDPTFTRETLLAALQVSLMGKVRACGHYFYLCEKISLRYTDVPRLCLTHLGLWSMNA